MLCYQSAISCLPLGILAFPEEQDHRVLGKKQLWEHKGVMTQEMGAALGRGRLKCLFITRPQPLLLKSY